MLGEKEFYERQLDYERGLAASQPSMWRRLLNRFLTNRFEVAGRLVEDGERVLDLACDRGWLFGRIAHKFDRLYGLDIAFHRLSVLRDKEFPTRTARERPAGLVCANANVGLPFADGAFTCVCALAILEHVFDVYGFLMETRRVIAPGGILILEVPNIAYIRHRIRLLLGGLPVTSSPHGWDSGFGWDGGHLHYFTVSTLRQLLLRTGFHVERISSSGGTFAGIRNMAPALLAGNIAVRARNGRADGGSSAGHGDR